MIGVKIRSFRGIVAADIELCPIALISGRNHQGKSSIAQAVAAAMTNSPVPFFRSEKPESALFTKGAAKQLANDGGKPSGVRLEQGKNRIQIAWPDLEVKIEGEPPTCGKVAAGLVTPIDMGDTERANFFSTVLASNPTKEDFIAALTTAKYPVVAESAALENIWESIEVSGWDAVHKRIREEGTKTKGAWERVTGTKYGSDKAATFRPPSYDDDLNDLTLEQLEEAAATTRQKVDDLNAGSAVADEQIKRLTSDAATETELLSKSKPAKERLEAARLAVTKAEEVLAPLRMPHVYGCTHCGGMNKLTFARDGTFTVEISDLKESDIEAMKQKRSLAQKALDEANKDLGTASSEWNEMKGRYKAVEGSGDKLEAAMNKTGDADGLAALQDELRTHDARYLAKKTYDEALMLHQKVASNQILIDIIDSSGLRQTKLQEKLALFNSVLAGYCLIAGYQPVKVSAELEVTLGDRHYVLLSDSEKYRCRAILQVAAAVYEKSNFAIFDGADILDSPGRNGLFKLLKSLAPAFHALVGMTFGKPDTVPDMAKAGMGKTYWIEAGACGPLPVAKAA